nr:uncharacterized protein LOC125180728 [Anser cygnoides]
MGDGGNLGAGGLCSVGLRLGRRGLPRHRPAGGFAARLPPPGAGGGRATKLRGPAEPRGPGPGPGRGRGPRPSRAEAPRQRRAAAEPGGAARGPSTARVSIYFIGTTTTKIIKQRLWFGLGCLRSLLQRSGVALPALVSDGHDLMEDVPDVLLPAVAVCPFVSVGRRQGHAPLHRVAGQVHAGQSLQHPGLLVHAGLRRSPIDAAGRSGGRAGCAAGGERSGGCGRKRRIGLRLPKSVSVPDSSLCPRTHAREKRNK